MVGGGEGQDLAESFQPGAKGAAVARRHGMNRTLLWNWRHEARKRGADVERTFVPIRVMDALHPICGEPHRRHCPTRSKNIDAMRGGGNSREYRLRAGSCCGGGMAVLERSPARSRLRWKRPRARQRCG